MVRWTAVPTRRLGGLDVMFYKVQYRRLGGRRKSRGWETVDEDIPSNKLAVRVNRLRPGQLLVTLARKIPIFGIFWDSREPRVTLPNSSKVCELNKMQNQW